MPRTHLWQEIDRRSGADRESVADLAEHFQRRLEQLALDPDLRAELETPDSGAARLSHRNGLVRRDYPDNDALIAYFSMEYRYRGGIAALLQAVLACLPATI